MPSSGVGIKVLMMANDRERFTKVLTLAIHPETVPGEALAAFNRARELAKENPSLAHPPTPPREQKVTALDASYNARITAVHPDWVLILVGLLSNQAYKEDLRYKISFDF